MVDAGVDRSGPNPDKKAAEVLAKINIAWMKAKIWTRKVQS